MKISKNITNIQIITATTHSMPYLIYTYIMEANADIARNKMEIMADLVDMVSDDSPVVDGVVLDPAVKNENKVY
jgi:hypothetical protein